MQFIYIIFVMRENLFIYLQHFANKWALILIPKLWILSGIYKDLTAVKMD